MGGKSGGYSGPSASEIQAQRDAYRQQWDLEKAMDEQKKIISDENVKKEATSQELKDRRGVGNVLANSQIGFTKAPSPDELDPMFLDKV